MILYIIRKRGETIVGILYLSTIILVYMRMLKNIQLCNDQRIIDMHSVIKCLYINSSTQSSKNGVPVNSVDRTTTKNPLTF